MILRKSVKLTTKRQATLPVQLCEELGVGPGDRLLLERRVLEGEVVWVLRRPEPDWSWAASLKRYGVGRSHDWAAIERSIERGRADEPGA